MAKTLVMMNTNESLTKVSFFGSKLINLITKMVLNLSFEL